VSHLQQRGALDRKRRLSARTIFVFIVTVDLMLIVKRIRHAALFIRYLK